ncbi:alkaline phosphatase D family protein [Phenylobacterium sp. LjRoot225]
MKAGSATRRGALAGLAASLALPSLVRAQASFAEFPFSLGVASGDPASDGFVIWTRLAPRALEPHGGMPMTPVAVAWEVAEDDRFQTISAHGEALARPELGHSVHVELSALKPNRPYWYRFTAGGAQSPVGRAKTLPAMGARLDRVRFVAAGCQSFENGFYTAYRRIAGEELDFLWHYGDYIYEGRGAASPAAAATPGPVRRHLGDELYSLDDYRRRYAQYKSDPDLQAAHAAHSWWVTWDDHETDNNWAADISQDATPPEIFDLRREAAAQAYYEHMPLRRRSFPRGPAIQIYRQAAYGDLLDCHFLDTRQFRDDQPCGDGFKPSCADGLRPERTIMGAQEERWLFEALAKGSSRWNFIGQQVMMMPLDRRKDDVGPPIWNMDSWAGYPAARRRLLDHLRQAKVGNAVVATGDEHQNFAGELRAGDGDGPVAAVEFVATSISSGGDGSDLRAGSDRILAHNPHLKFINDQRGYVVCDVGRDLWRTDFKVLDAVSRRDGKLSTRASFTVERNAPGLHAG